MSIFDSILSQVTQNVDVANMATKLGISPAIAEQAIAALGAAHPQPGDTVATAAAQTGIESTILSQIVSHIGGEGSLGQFAQLVQAHPEASQMVSGLLDRNHDGSVVDDVMGIAGGLLGGKA